jgi:ATP-independent RNA helicase DbpA
MHLEPPRHVGRLAPQFAVDEVADAPGAEADRRQRCGEVEDVDELAAAPPGEQRERDQVMVQFANRSCSVLVATDIAARGLDIAQLEAVINVDITPDAATHTHRIGRTGRVDEEGWAFSLASMDEMGSVGKIEQAGGFSSEWKKLSELTPTSNEPLRAPMQTIQILGGRKEKIRPGDVLGALTKDLGFAGTQIGKINVNEFSTYVAVERGIAPDVLRKLASAKVKGRSVKVRMLEGDSAQD